MCKNPNQQITAFLLGDPSIQYAWVNENRLCLHASIIRMAQAGRSGLRFNLLYFINRGGS